MEELNIDPVLRGIILTLSVNNITREMYLSDRGIQKMLIIDEAWDLLGDAKTGGFIETAFRRIRKYFGAAGIITQSFEDFDRSEAAKAAFANSAWKFILKQKSSSLDYARKEGKLADDDFLIDLISSVRPGAGFSEIFIEHDNGQGLFKFIVDPHTHYTYTTNPRDIADLDDLEKVGYTVMQAVDYMATQQLVRIKALTEEEGKATLTEIESVVAENNQNMKTKAVLQPLLQEVVAS